MRYRKLLSLIAGIAASAGHAIPISPLQNQNTHPYFLNSLSGFFRFSYDHNIKMPKHIQHMGLLGFNYFADITPLIYGGFGGYGSVIGTQGGLFTLGVAGGVHYEFFPHVWGDAGLFVGGGGGRASLVGGGLMLRPHVGIAYDFNWARLGVYYSYLSFPSGEIHSQQVGLNLDLPMDFYYLTPKDCQAGCYLFNPKDIKLCLGKFLAFQRNDFALLLQAYRQKPGTKNVDGKSQDGTIKLVGAEFDHYFTENIFWWFKTSGAFAGIPNGYMDALGGLGYHFSLGAMPFAIVPQLGMGAGGGGAVDTGGGFLINPLIGLEWAALPSFSLRVSSGYLWSPKGELKAIPITGEVLYHLDIATASTQPSQFLGCRYKILGWRFQFFNQTYFHPQRSFTSTTSPIQLLGIQIDQIFTPNFFFSYQAAGAYSGFHAGGYATGMIGPGIQSDTFCKDRVQLFAELLVGAGGGGGLALSGGSLIEPMVGVRYGLTPTIGLQASGSQLKALRDDLNTPVFNIGLTIRFDVLNRQ